MLSATKEKIGLLFPLAAPLSENGNGFVPPNPHRGHQFPTAALYPSQTVANSNTTTSLTASFYDFPIRPRCTGKERDAETGLDWFESRYLSGAQGRFTTPDELLRGVEFENPQSWNRYAYTLNNPLRYIDPSGHEPCENGIDPENGNICTVVTPKKQPPPPQISPFDIPGQWFGGFVNFFLNEEPSGAGQMAYAYVAQLAPGPVLGVIGEVAENGPTLAKYMNILRRAASLKGNFGLGEATAQEAAEVGQAWVGEGATVATDGKTLVSSDGLRQYRPPSFKPNLGKVQANFESRPVPTGQWQTNGHLDIK